MTSENVYHVKRTRTDFKDPAGPKEKVRIFGTFVDLKAAKELANKALLDEGYEKDWFPTYDVKSESTSWTHGDGVMVYAKAPEGEVFKVEIETAPNKLNLSGDSDGRVGEELYHVLQTTIHYNIDRSGSKRDTAIEGSYKTSAEAKTRALTVLLDEDVEKKDFEEYDEFKGQSDWPFDEGVMVHAVGQGGENYLVSVVKE